MWNLAQLRASVKTKLGRDDKDDSIPTWLNFGQERIANEYVFWQWKGFETINVTGLTHYALNTGLRALYRVRFVSSTYRPKLPYMTVDDIEEAYDEAFIEPQSGLPVGYTVLGDGIYPYPYPLTGTLHLYRALYPNQLVNDSDLLSIPYGELVVIAGVIVAMEDMQYDKDIIAPFYASFGFRLTEAKSADGGIRAGAVDKIEGYNTTRVSYRDPRNFV